MAKLTKRQQKAAEMLEGFVQPSSAADALKKFKKFLKQQLSLMKPLNAICVLVST